MGTTSDYFVKVGSPGTATTLSAPGHSIGGAAITVGSTANWPGIGETVIFAIDTVTIQTINGVATEVRNANSYTEWQALVTSSTSLGSLVLRTGTDQNYSSGTTTRVYIPVASARENRLIDGITTSLNQDGTLKASAVQTALGLSASIGAGWTPLANTFTYGANNGNKEFTVTTASDLTTTLSPGMRFQLTRGTAAPTQAMSFTAASSQHASKTTPTGITFTAALTCEAWIYLNSYTGNNQGIIGRWNGTNGFLTYLNGNGQVVGQWDTAGTTNLSSQQSIPLKRWTHVAWVVSSVSGRTASIYINGVLVPTTSTVTTSTTLTQAGPLTIGSYNAGAATSFFDGYISEARIWSVGQTQAQIQANMAISLTGSETNLVALFQGNGNFNDKTANANNLTANGGAIATQVANPYNNVEYALVAKVSYSTPNTTITLFTGTDYNIPNMTLTSVQYSSQKVPFGFPGARGRWKVDFVMPFQAALPNISSNVWGGSVSLSIPAGDWEAAYSATHVSDVGAGGSREHFMTLSTSSSAESDPNWTTWGQIGNSIPANASLASVHSRQGFLSLSAQTVYYLLIKDINAVANNRLAFVSLISYCAHI